MTLVLSPDGLLRSMSNLSSSSSSSSCLPSSSWLPEPVPELLYPELGELTGDP